jgi:hypothetical protein
LVNFYQTTRRYNPDSPDDGGSKDLWNVGKLLPDYTALQPRSPWWWMQQGPLKRW